MASDPVAETVAAETVVAEPPAKKAKKVDVKKEFQEIVSALSVAEKSDVPSEVIVLLKSMLEHALLIPKAERHAFQTEVVDMAAQAISKAETVLQAEIAKVEALVNGADAEKEKRDADEIATAAAHTACVEAIQARTTEKADKLTALKAAEAALKEVQKKQKDGDADSVVVEKSKSTFDAALVLLAELKEGKGGKRQFNHFLKDLEVAKFEDSLMKCLHLPLTKKPEEQGSFDKVVLQQLDTVIAAKKAEFEGQIAAAAPEKEARANAVNEAQAALAAAKAAHDGATEALTAANKAEVDAKKAAAAAKAAVKSFASDILGAAKSLDSAKTKLAKFQAGPQASFARLRDGTEA
eukprot:TRINITY_DN12726_c0_g1_i1.p1 TRINITY_DN12726_c0_g1~~TRINITY_DN12726_c0_g1_i1.p1  ORF type:complete len:352 (-),score=142.74 TRINITY_DN12726_c0_g1_i1:116-1171(-)